MSIKAGRCLVVAMTLGGSDMHAPIRIPYQANTLGPDGQRLPRTEYLNAASGGKGGLNKQLPCEQPFHLS